MSATLVDGRKLAHERIRAMRTFVAEKQLTPTLTALTIAPNAPTQQFLRIKSRVAEEVGVVMEVLELPLGTQEAELYLVLERVLRETDGVVMQLPFPEDIAIDRVLTHIPQDLDPDCMGSEAGALLRSHEHIVLPPVVSAIRAIAQEHTIAFSGKRVVVIGQGRLVGAPAASWLEEEGAQVVRLTRSETDIAQHTKNADVIVLGAGAPGLLVPEMIQDGAVIFDAGTSEEGGRVVGDADPLCATRAALITPVPGGIGPLAVAELFGNLLRLRFDFNGGQ